METSHRRFPLRPPVEGEGGERGGTLLVCHRALPVSLQPRSENSWRDPDRLDAALVTLIATTRRRGIDE